MARNTDVRKTLLMDPFVAVLSLICAGGSTDGYLFRDVNEKEMMGYDMPWSTSDFTTFLRLRLRMRGVGKDDLVMYTGHSIKCGCVQLYRSLDLRDEQIMEIVQMRGTNAYTNYDAAYNNCHPPDIPRFTNVAALIEHVETVSGELTEK